MASIVFLVDYEEGHVLPTFGLAQSLQKRGHDINYIGIHDLKELVIANGFKFHVIDEASYPKEISRKFKEAQRNYGISPKIFFYDIVEDEICDLLLKINPNVVIVNTFLSLEALLISYFLNIKPVIFTPYFLPRNSPRVECMQYLYFLSTTNVLKLLNYYMEVWSGTSLTTSNSTKLKDLLTREILDKFLSPLDEFTEIVACPQQFDYSIEIKKSNTFYIEPSIRKETYIANRSFIFNLHKESRKIIYASMGSQNLRIATECEKIFRKLIGVMNSAAMQDHFLILSTGTDLKFADLHPLPENIKIFEWVSQIEVLKFCKVAIIHGGFNSVKECIFYGVPMIIFPMGYDQPENANRVEFHGLGVQENYKTITEEKLALMIIHLSESKKVKQNISKMQEIFWEKESDQEGVLLIEKIAANN